VGKRCILIGGSTRNRLHRNRKLLDAKAVEKKGIKKRQLESLASAQHVGSKKESHRALLARLKRESVKPALTKSVRDRVTKKQLAAWNAR
jgi:hypothetical protein